jgi:hypothetical protein
VIAGDASWSESTDQRHRALDAVRQTALQHGYDLEQLLSAAPPADTGARRLPTEAPELKGLIGGAPSSPRE